MPRPRTSSSALRPLLTALLLIPLVTNCGSTVSTARLEPEKVMRIRMKSRDWRSLVAETRKRLDAERLTVLWKRDPQIVVRHLNSQLAEGEVKPGSVAVLALDTARRREASDPASAPGAYLTAADVASTWLRKSGVPASRWPKETETRRLLTLYNWAVWRFVSLEFERGHLRQDQPREILGLDGTPYRVRMIDPRVFGNFRPEFIDELAPSDELKIHGFKHLHRTTAVGASFVGLRRNLPERAREMAYHSKRGALLPLTALLTFPPATDQRRPRPAEVALVDSSARSEISIGGSRLPLSVDRTAPLAVALDGESQIALGLGGLLRAEKVMDKTGLYMLGPYDPNRIPVLMIHGLTSSLLMWRDMIDILQADPLIAERYQFWLFYYPTGNPVPISAKLLRDNLAGARRHFDPDGNDPAFRNQVVIGHSMGGLLARTLVTEVDDRLWKAVSDRGFDELQLPADRRKEVRDTLFFKSVPGIRRVIFLNTPHRGARLADRWFSRLGSWLIRLPVRVVTLQILDTRANHGLIKDEFTKRRPPTSIQSLSPEAPIFKALQTSPRVPGVRFHSIIGDRGRGDSPHSSDGFVEYWSSHLDDVESELIVPDGHGAYKDPKSVAEVRRILLEHIGAR